MYSRVLVGLDGSECSDLAGDAAIELAKAFGAKIVACHVYAAEMHRARFGEMEIGLPQRYQEPDRLEHLRGAHEDIISGGMRIISGAYLASFIGKASAAGLAVEGKTPEGRNYVEFLKVLADSNSDLVVVGADGQGRVKESTLGSFTERTLLLGSKDLLVMRSPWSMKGRPIVVGVDGSASSYLALEKAVEIAARAGSAVHAVAVYDPFFHANVFSSISTALTKEQSSKFNFAAQERLHDEIIDDGLRALYDKRLDKGLGRIAQKDITIKKEVLTGKVFKQIAHYANVVNAGLVVVGKYGVHREKPSLIGSTTHALARISQTNLLVVSNENGSDERAGAIQSPTVEPRIPSQPAKDDESLRARSDPASPFVENRPEAEMVTLKKAKRLAPAFHEHIVRARIVGNQVQAGSRFMVFDVVRTQPEGKVTVTERTRLEFI